MALIKTVNNISPKISKSVYIADNATILGDVTIGEKSSVWFNTVLRGDVNSIYIGKNVNIQDGTVIHCTYNKSKVKLETIFLLDIMLLFMVVLLKIMF